MMRAAVICSVMLLAASARAQDGHHHGGAATSPVEAGQSTFAAVAEIVSMLHADPATDWSRVDIGALQAHLADMDTVFLRAMPSETEVEGGLRIVVSGEGADGDAVRRMVTAHAPELDALPGIAAGAEPTATGAILTVTADEPALAAQIRALGFFGLMATGAHHQAHHWAIATGGSPHAH